MFGRVRFFRWRVSHAILPHPPAPSPKHQGRGALLAWLGLDAELSLQMKLFRIILLDLLRHRGFFRRSGTTPHPPAPSPKHQGRGALLAWLGSDAELSLQMKLFRIILLDLLRHRGFFRRSGAACDLINHKDTKGTKGFLPQRLRGTERRRSRWKALTGILLCACLAKSKRKRKGSRKYIGNQEQVL